MNQRNMIVFRSPIFEVVYKAFSADGEIYATKSFPFQTGQELASIIREKDQWIREKNWLKFFEKEEKEWQEDFGISYVEDITHMELAGIQISGDNPNGDALKIMSFDLPVAVIHLAHQPEE